MTDMNCFAAADFLNSIVVTLLGALVLQKTKRGQFIKSSGRENMNENTKREQERDQSTWQVCIVLLVGSM